ncbi:hypothetical protein C0J52_05326 [Blattella germanica]|nr:hypothetical protein C0J52_05326 [Blattella germanica]
MNDYITEDFPGVFQTPLEYCFEKGFRENCDQPAFIKCAHCERSAYAWIMPLLPICIFCASDSDVSTLTCLHTLLRFQKLIVSESRATRDAPFHCLIYQTPYRRRHMTLNESKMGIESSSEEEDDGEGQEEQSLISWIIRGSLSLAMNDTLFL